MVLGWCVAVRGLACLACDRRRLNSTVSATVNVANVAPVVGAINAPDDVVQLITSSGSPDEVRRKVAEYRANGCTCPILYPLGDVKMMIDTFAQTQPVIGDQSIGRSG